MHNFVMFGLKKSVIENSGKIDPIHYAGSVAALPAFLSIWIRELRLEYFEVL